MDLDAGLVYRSYGPEDIPFVRSSWANSFFKGVDAHKALTPKEFHSFHRKTIDRFFEKPMATVIIVHLENEPNIIMGWIAVELLIEFLIVHYIYIKGDFQKLTLATRLIKRVNSKNQSIIITHLTDKASRILKHQKKELTYIPHLI